MRCWAKWYKTKMPSPGHGTKYTDHKWQDYRSISLTRYSCASSQLTEVTTQGNTCFPFSGRSSVRCLGYLLSSISQLKGHWLCLDIPGCVLRALLLWGLGQFTIHDLHLSSGCWWQHFFLWLIDTFSLFFLHFILLIISVWGQVCTCHALMWKSEDIFGSWLWATYHLVYIELFLVLATLCAPGWLVIRLLMDPPIAAS